MPDRRGRIAAALGAAIDEVAFASAPGRVNLIGEHTDYTGGLVLPLVIDRRCVAGAHPRSDGGCSGGSLDLPGTDLRPWLAALDAPPLDVVVASDVPIGAGLASSGALSVALARIAGAGDEPLALADAARAAEERVTGVPCGLMDQLAGAAGRPRQALLIDCRARAFRHVPLPEDAAVVVVDSGIRRSLSDGRYAERRAACERAAALLGVATLRDATEAEAAHMPEARHVVSENARVAAMVAALGAGDLRAAGEVMCDGHRSLRDDLRVSTPELDDLVERLVRAGAHGARLTGAGFGGCVVALAGRETAADMLGRAGLVAVTTC